MHARTDRPPVLRWGVKESFRAYVGGLPDGVISCADGAQQSESGDFQFPIDLDASWVGEGGGNALVATRGHVSFSGHGGHLRVTLERVQLQIEDGRLRLSVADASGPGSTVIARGTGVLTGGLLRGVPRITTLGSEMLGGTYPVGTDLDAVEADVSQVTRSTL